MDDSTILVLGDPTDPSLAGLAGLPDATHIAVGDRVEAFAQAAPAADVIFNWSGSRELLQQVWRMAPQVRWVHSRAAGLDDLLFPELAGSPVPLTNARGVFSGILAEFVIGAVLFFAKGFRRLVRSQEAGLWDQFDTVEVAGQTMGVIGFGDIGKAVARRAEAMGLHVLPVPRGTAQQDKLALLSRCDYVVLSAPLTPETRGIVGAAELRAMRTGAVLINVGRGPLVDEAALVDALREKRMGGAALDVFDQEPLPAAHPYYSLDNVLLSPHSADHTSDWKQRAMQVFLDNFELYRKGEPLRNVVDKRRGY